MRKIIFIIILISSQICFSQTVEETVDFINGKLKTHSSLYAGHYEIEISNLGNLKVHRYDINQFEKDLSKNKQHFISMFDLKSVNIEVKESDSKGKELFTIWFKCPDKRNCVQETFVHNNKKSRHHNLFLVITDKVNLYKLEKAFRHLQKIYKNKKEPF